MLCSLGANNRYFRICTLSLSLSLSFPIWRFVTINVNSGCSVCPTLANVIWGKERRRKDRKRGGRGEGCRELFHSYTEKCARTPVHPWPLHPSHFRSCQEPEKWNGSWGRVMFSPCAFHLGLFPTLTGGEGTADRDVFQRKLDSKVGKSRLELPTGAKSKDKKGKEADATLQKRGQF